MRQKIFTGILLDVSVFVGLLALGILQGYHFCAGDLDTYLPFILHDHDPSLFKNELLLGTLGSHPVYIWKTMAFFLQWLDVRHLLQCAFLVQTFLIASGAVVFFRRFFGPGRKWMFFLLMLVIPVTSGGYGVYGLNPYGYFHAGALAFGLVLLTYVCIDSGFWAIGGILTGTIFLFHPVTAMYALFFFVLRALFDLVQKKRPAQIFPGALLLFVVALPSLIPAFHSFLTPAGGGFDTHLWRQLARFRMNHGYFISAWVPDRFLQIAGCYLVLVLGFRKHPAFNRLLPVMLAVAGGLALAAIGDCFTIRLLLRLQLGRCSYFIYFLAAAFTAGALTDRTLWDKVRKTRYSWNLIALIVLIIIGHAAVSEQPHWVRIIVTSLLVIAVGMIAVRFFVPFHPGPFFACCAAIVLTATIPRSTYMVTWTMARNMQDPWVDCSRWCAKSVPRDAIVMIPLAQENFRPWALRATYCTWKDGAPHLFCDSTLSLWWRRMQQFGVTLSSKRSEFPDLYRARAITIARSEGIRYVVFDKSFMRATGPVAYENKYYGVIDLKGWDGYGLEKNN
jgi:hypothetical protein